MKLKRKKKTGGKNNNQKNKNQIWYTKFDNPLWSFESARHGNRGEEREKKGK